MAFCSSDGGELIGYTDRLSAAPGEDIRLHASASNGSVSLDVVHVLHGDPNPAGPGLLVEHVPTQLEGTYPAAEQQLRAGSYAACSAERAGPATDKLSIWFWTLRPSAGHHQVLISRGESSIYLDDAGVLSARVGDAVMAATAPVRQGRWCRVELQSTGKPELRLDGTVVAASDAAGILADGMVTLAAAVGDDGQATNHFTGRLEELELDDKVFDVRELDLINGPTLAVTGRLWQDDTTDFRANRPEYAAVHFHEDDLDDARWHITACFTVPDELRSGIYAFRMRSAGLVDHVPFVVTPSCGGSTADIAFLLPTLTYLAYSNERLIAAGDGGMVPTGAEPQPGDADRWLARHPEAGGSVYDRHVDGTGVSLVSMHRPIPNLRPDFVWWNTASPERFGADLYIADFLDRRGDAWDALTDHDLHEQGVELLNRYRVVVTGTHPEYCSRAMLVAIQAYLESGGRVLYLGGNGFYWVTSIDPQRPYLAEVRRGINGTRAWSSRPGELRHQTTGEQGGLWRYRNRPPNALVGVGFASQADAVEKAPGYQRTPDSHLPQHQWIFAGVSDADVIGDYGLYVGGAAGYEIDRHDTSLGSPADSVVLMTSQGMHSDAYLLVVEDMDVTTPDVTGTANRDVRSDVVLLPYPGGGAVFSVGSCSWAGSLSHNDYDNDIYRITDNVLSGFLVDGPLAAQ
jgi:N,N-dimethylformamidase